MYEKKLETLDDLLESDVVYGYYPIISIAIQFTNIPELVTFLELKRLQEDCADVRKCVERMITKRDIASIIPPLYVTYVVRDFATADVL
jgi:hypothetical protein